VIDWMLIQHLEIGHHQLLPHILYNLMYVTSPTHRIARQIIFKLCTALLNSQRTFHYLTNIVSPAKFCGFDSGVACWVTVITADYPVTLHSHVISNKQGVLIVCLHSFVARMN
jgi:hypothetical protein